ncbi:MAG: hypothetical protein V1827_02215 [Candidatus Micrarchaeota archaeon]
MKLNTPAAFLLASFLLIGCMSLPEEEYHAEVPAIHDGPPILCEIMPTESGNFSYELTSSIPFDYILIDMDKLQTEGKDPEWVAYLNESGMGPENELEREYLGTAITGIITETGRSYYSNTTFIHYTGMNVILGITKSKSDVFITSNMKIRCKN